MKDTMATPAEREMVRLFIENMREKLQVKVEDISLVKRSESDYDTGRRVSPYMTIYARGEDHYKLAEDQAGISMLKEDLNLDVRACWREAVRACVPEDEEYYDKRMFFRVIRYETQIYWDYALQHKQDVAAYLAGKLGRPPMFVRAASRPGLNITFSPEDYETLRVDERSEELRQGIIELAKSTVKPLYGELDCPLVVTFWHKNMPKYSGSMLARED